ncbi:MAG: hypothetical protein PF448_01020 [Bacteroidales bacterium]|jgi:hypothetical protein|nr:hypothetical protein [Bacteroidales bacterium]
MKSRFLFPHRFKLLGLILLIPALSLSILTFFFDFEPEFLMLNVFAFADVSIFSDSVYFGLVENNIANELAGILLILACLFIAFSRGKHEDEYIAKIRLESLLWATYINYAVLILSLIFLYNMAFFYILILNMFTLLFIFIVRFYFILFKMKRSLPDEA